MKRKKFENDEVSEKNKGSSCKVDDALLEWASLLSFIKEGKKENGGDQRIVF